MTIYHGDSLMHFLLRPSKYRRTTTLKSNDVFEIQVLFVIPCLACICVYLFVCFQAALEDRAIQRHKGREERNFWYRQEAFQNVLNGCVDETGFIILASELKHL